MGSVRADITAFVIGVDGQVQAHQFDEGVILGKAKLIGEVPRVILVLLYGRDFAILVDYKAILIKPSRNRKPTIWMPHLRLKS